MQVLASMMRPGKTAPSVSVGVDNTKEALTALSSLHCSMRQRLDHLLLRIGVAVSVDEVHRIQKTGVNLTPDHRSADQTLQVFRHPRDHAVQVRNRQCRTGSTALAVQFKSLSPEWGMPDTAAPAR